MICAGVLGKIALKSIAGISQRHSEAHGRHKITSKRVIEILQ